jgi:ACT domain-containing protein
MLYLRKIENAKGGWNWQLGQVTLAYSYVASTTDPGLFLFVISGVHRQGAELFSTHERAEALLQKHVQQEIALVEHAPAQEVQIAREDRWIKMKRDDPPQQEQDTYKYLIGNVVLGELSNTKSIKSEGYSLYLSMYPAKPRALGILSISEGERLLSEALACKTNIALRTTSYGLGPNHLPCEADIFSCQPLLYSGRPAW